MTTPRLGKRTPLQADLRYSNTAVTLIEQSHKKYLVSINLAAPIPLQKRKGWSLKIWSMLQKTVTPIKLHCSKFLEHLFWSYHRYYRNI